MSSISSRRKSTVTDIKRRKDGDPIVCLTAYTAMMTEILDPHVDLILVGDSLGTVLHGHDSTVPVTMDEMMIHAKSVANASPNALLVVDMPFGSYETGPVDAFKNASRFLKEAGADAVKLEGGVAHAETIRYLVERGIPVMGHIGLRPQAVRATGGYRIVGKTEKECDAMRADAQAVADAGAFCVVLEGVVEPLARELTAQISIPTIGIGASVVCDGQILVTEDLLGMFNRSPKFVRRFARLRETIDEAIGEYADSVRKRSFPADAETYANDNGK